MTKTTKQPAAGDNVSPEPKPKRAYRKKVAVIGNPEPPAPLTSEESRLTEEEKDAIRKGFLLSEENPTKSPTPELKKGQRMVTFISPPAPEKGKKAKHLLADKIRPNDPCRCKSGKKAKHCCGTETKYFVSKN